jgi:predicted small secreted protein
MNDNMVILYSHHCKSDVTLYHYELLKKHNPNNKIVPIGFSWHDLIENSYVVTRKPYLPNNQELNIRLNGGKSTSSESDLQLYEFYINHQDYDSYFLIEWDTYCNCSIKEYYNEKLNLDNFCSYSFNYKNSYQWSWYNLLSTEQKKLKIGGMYPTSCLYFKNHILYEMVNILMNNISLYNNMQNETRLGTLLQEAGYDIKEFSGDTIHFYDHPEYKEKIKNKIKGYYHPIKEIL